MSPFAPILAIDILLAASWISTHTMHIATDRSPVPANSDAPNIITTTKDNAPLNVHQTFISRIYLARVQIVPWTCMSCKYPVPELHHHLVAQ
jgi:hypothetical protein